MDKNIYTNKQQQQQQQQQQLQRWERMKKSITSRNYLL